jgi:hypothetical protein
VQDDMNITLVATDHEKLPDLPRFHGITDGTDWPPAKRQVSRRQHMWGTRLASFQLYAKQVGKTAVGRSAGWLRSGRSWRRV